MKYLLLLALAVFALAEEAPKIVVSEVTKSHLLNPYKSAVVAQRDAIEAQQRASSAASAYNTIAASEAKANKLPEGSSYVPCPAYMARPSQCAGVAMDVDDVIVVTVPTPKTTAPNSTTGKK